MLQNYGFATGRSKGLSTGPLRAVEWSVPASIFLAAEVSAMGLQLRVKHALGARMTEVPERGLDRPIAVGRDTACEVQIPSGAVAPMHCLLWQQDGEWVVQDNGSEAGTAVNGELVSGPVFVKMGDIISL